MRMPIAIALILIPGAAQADETRYSSEAFWSPRLHSVSPVERIDHRSHRPHRPHRPRHHHHKPDPPPASPSPPAPIVPSYGIQCLAEIRAMGTPHVSESAAMDSAKRHWQAIARYDHGEKYMSIETARHVRYRCVRAETNETAMGRAVETVTGGDAWRMRCEIVAHPCRPEMKETP